MWLVWIDAYVNGMSLRVARLFRDTEIGYRPSFHLGSMLAALALTVLWVALVRPARRSNRRAILNWAAGVTLIWGLATTIWLPYLDSRRSYRWMVEALAREVPSEGCLASRNLGEPQRALFYYFARHETVREEVDPAHNCDCAGRAIWPPRRRSRPAHADGRQSGAARAEVTTPSASSCIFRNHP